MNYYFITGTSKGIGKALAEIYLANENNKVFGYARTQTIKHPQYEHRTFDFSKPEQLANFKFPELNDSESVTLINNSGVISEILRLGKLQNDSIINDTTVNLTAPIVLMNTFLKQYQKKSVPRLIINISSGAARRAIDAWGTYCATKSGLDMISEVIHTEQQFQKPEHRIKIFSVAPGVVDTQMQVQIRNTKPEDFSNLQRFIELKENNALFSAEKSAELISKLTKNPDIFQDVICDVRNF